MVLGFGALFSRKPPPNVANGAGDAADNKASVLNNDNDNNDNQSPSKSRTPLPFIEGNLKQLSPAHEPPPTPSPPPDLEPVMTTSGLRTLIQSVPPQTLHSYTLFNLPSSPSTVFSHLSLFFSGLTPPPQLHCVRCHKFFFELENTDQSCLIPHDDESAEVERVRGSYETTWGCCGNTVEGDGDMGPPDGWCYEGKHTTDIKRARFRADSTIHDDKLTSCGKLKCHVNGTPPDAISSSHFGKRSRNQDDNGDKEREDDRKSVRSSGTRRSHGGGSKGRLSTSTTSQKQTDKDMEESGLAPVTSSPKRKQSTRRKQATRTPPPSPPPHSTQCHKHLRDDPKGDGWDNDTLALCGKLGSRNTTRRPDSAPRHSRKHSRYEDANHRADDEKVEDEEEDHKSVRSYGSSTTSKRRRMGSTVGGKIQNGKDHTQLAEMDVDTPSLNSLPNRAKPKPKSSPGLIPKPSSIRSKPTTTSKTPQTSSPLVLAPSFIPPATPPPSSSKAKSKVKTQTGSPERTRKSSGASVRRKTKSLAEVVDSSVDGERLRSGYKT